jgi:hypothetical protein
MPMQDGVGQRARRLAVFGSGVFSRQGDWPDREAELGTDRTAAETRLAFDYLRGDFSAAAADLERLEPLVASRLERFSLLSLRAQILWSRGDRAEARAVADYLLSATGSQNHHVDETPVGLAAAPQVNPKQAWARYISKRIGEVPAPQVTPAVNVPDDGLEPALQNPFGAPDAPAIERGAGAIPFAPILPGPLGREIERLIEIERLDLLNGDEHEKGRLEEWRAVRP